MPQWTTMHSEILQMSCCSMNVKSLSSDGNGPGSILLSDENILPVKQRLQPSFVAIFKWMFILHNIEQY